MGLCVGDIYYACHFREKPVGLTSWVTVAVNIIPQTWTHTLNLYTCRSSVKRDSDLDQIMLQGLCTQFDLCISLFPSLKENTDLCLLRLSPDWVWTPSCWQRSSTCLQVVAGPAIRTTQSQASWRESPQPTTTRAALEPH